MFAEHEFRLNVTDENGITLRQHYKQSKAWHELEPPVEFPELLAHVWEYFIELNNARSPDSAITYESIKAYMEVAGVKLEPWQIEVIKRLDVKFLNSHRLK